MSGNRPEHIAPPEIFYSRDEAVKYTTNSRMMEIQMQMSERAIELLALPDEKCFILDIGCGSGLSGTALEEEGHHWVGIDISQAMLDVAMEREVEGDAMLGDMGQGMCFRAGTFDGAISISALQWLCNADKKSHKPVQRLSKFFSTLYACLARGSRAVFQFYPENSAQIELVTQQAMKAGFNGGLVVDYPNSSKAKKHFLVLMTGGIQKLPAALGAETAPDHVQYVTAREGSRNRKRKREASGKAFILEKKARKRKQGKTVHPDTKYTGRRRCGKF